MGIPTDSEMLVWVMSALEAAASGSESPELAASGEALDQGYRLGLRGRELICAAMHAVRFDVEPERAEQLHRQLRAEATDTERLNTLDTWMHREDGLALIHGSQGYQIYEVHEGSITGWLVDPHENLRGLLDAMGLAL